MELQWMVSYAEEYEISDDRITYRGSWDCVGNIQVSPLYPLLLQRTIEGIEKTRDIEILAYWNKSGKCYESQVFKTESDFPDFQVTYTDCKTIDEAKKLAIDYVYEQESNNENNM